MACQARRRGLAKGRAALLRPPYGCCHPIIDAKLPVMREQRNATTFLHPACVPLRRTIDATRRAVNITRNGGQGRPITVPAVRPIVRIGAFGSCNSSKGHSGAEHNARQEISIEYGHLLKPPKHSPSNTGERPRYSATQYSMSSEAFTDRVNAVASREFPALT